jgi:lysozyme
MTKNAKTETAASHLFGIDVSHHQGVIDWAKVKAAGVNYCFMKASEGSTFKDKRFDFNWNQTKANGIIRGAYHFFRPNAPVSRQVDNLVAKVGKLEVGDLPPVLDAEVPSSWTRFSVSKRVGMIEEWMVGVEEALGIKPILYLSPSFADDVLRNAAEMEKYVLWLAHYTSRSEPRVPAPWSKSSGWTFWQYSESGRLDGIGTNTVDLNRFKGSVEDLMKLTVQPRGGDGCTCPCTCGKAASN